MHICLLQFIRKLQNKKKCLREIHFWSKNTTLIIFQFKNIRQEEFFISEVCGNGVESGSIFQGVELIQSEGCKYFYIYKGSRKIAPSSPNFNANPKPNPNPDRGAIFLGGNFPDTIYKRSVKDICLKVNKDVLTLGFQLFLH